MRALAVAAVLCCAAACGTDPAPTTPTGPTLPVDGGGPSFASTKCVSNTHLSDWITRKFACLQRIPVTSPNDTISPKIATAIGIWNSEFQAHADMPQFITSAGTGFKVTITFDYSYNGTTWHCATTNVGTGAIQIHRSGVKADCGRTPPNGGGIGFTNAVQISDLSYLIAHELSHVIGFQHLSDAGLRTPAADHCIASLPANGGANRSLCQAEIQLIHYIYGLRDRDVNPALNIATGFESVSGPRTLNTNASGTLTVDFVDFVAAAPTFTPPTASTLKYSWKSSKPPIASVGTGTGASNTVMAGGTAGTTTITIALTSPMFDVAEPFSGGDVPITVVVPPTKPPPPTSLSASAVSYASATINWVNGASNTGTTTTLQYRQSGGTWATASSTIGAGVATYALTGLAPQTTYDVRLFHIRSGLNSDTLTRAALFATTAAPPPPAITNFHVTSCDQRPAGSKTFNYYQLAWTSAAAAAGYTFQIGVNTTSSSAGASVIVTYPLSARTGEVGGYLVSPTLLNRWFWIRYSGNGVTGAWSALADNPVATNACLQ